MIVRNFKQDDLTKVVTLWNENTQNYKPFNEETFTNHVLKHPDFKNEGFFVLEKK